MMLVPFNREIYKVLVSEARANLIDPNLCIAIATVESSWEPFAVRYEPNWKYFYKIELFAKKNRITEQTEQVLQACSWGLMQVMGSVARELGFSQPLQQLCGPAYGVEYGCKKLLELKKLYHSELDVISAYNQGSPVKLPNGDYKNQHYVDKVRELLVDLRADRHD